MSIAHCKQNTAHARASHKKVSPMHPRPLHHRYQRHGATAHRHPIWMATSLTSRKTIPVLLTCSDLPCQMDNNGVALPQHYHHTLFQNSPGTICETSHVTVNSLPLWQSMAYSIMRLPKVITRAVARNGQGHQYNVMHEYGMHSSQKGISIMHPQCHLPCCKQSHHGGEYVFPITPPQCQSMLAASRQHA